MEALFRRGGMWGRVSEVERLTDLGVREPLIWLRLAIQDRSVAQTLAVAEEFHAASGA